MRAMKGLPVLLALAALLSSAPRARAERPARPDKARALREMPCPDEPPSFDPARIDRKLKEPKYGSDRPLYRFFALGPKGETVVAMVADESQGAGKGVDALYVDLNANGDITEPAEKFAVPSPAPPGKCAKSTRADLATVQLGRWGQRVMPETKLPAADDVLDYRMKIESDIVLVFTATHDGSWRVPLRVMGDVPWSASRERAPVFRVGGSDFHLKNEKFVETHEGRRTLYVSGVGRKVRPGTLLSLDGTAPFFAGSSPEAYLGWYYVEGGHPGLRAHLESTQDPSRRVVSEIILRGY